jgi:hypothetical protein
MVYRKFFKGYDNPFASETFGSTFCIQNFDSAFRPLSFRFFASTSLLSVCRLCGEKK